MTHEPVFHWRIYWVPANGHDTEEWVNVTGTESFAEAVADEGPPSKYEVGEAIIERRGAVSPTKALAIVRRVPIDFADIARQSGLRWGKLCKTPFGWGVQNTHHEDGPQLSLIDPPPMLPGETGLRIESGHWVFTRETPACR